MIPELAYMAYIEYTEVYCDRFNEVTSARDGFCFNCGSTNHEKIN